MTIGTRNIAAIVVGGSLLLLANAAPAQELQNETEACRASSLVALRQSIPDLKDVFLDPESIAASKADTKIEDTRVTAVIIGDAYLESKRTDKARRFVCLIGDKGKVLLTFFMRE